MAEAEPTPAPCTVTCHTEGCTLQGQPRTINLYANAEPPVWRVLCDPCGQMITDIVPVS